MPLGKKISVIFVIIAIVGIVSVLTTYNLEQLQTPKTVSVIDEKVVPLSFYVESISGDEKYNAKFTGIIADQVCKFLEIPCPKDAKFNGNYDFNENTGGFGFLQNKIMYNFRVSGEEISVKTDDTNWTPITNSKTQMVPIETTYQIKTDKILYELGDTVHINGRIFDDQDNYFVLRVYDPQSNLIETDRIEHDGFFDYSFKIQSSYVSGKYYAIIDGMLLDDAVYFDVKEHKA